MAVLTAVRYKLGEQAESFSNAEGYGTIQMPHKPALWGWGEFRRTDLSIPELCAGTAKQTIAGFQFGPSEIDCVILCAGFSEDNRISPDSIPHMLSGLGVVNASVISIASDGCDAMLSAISIADAMVEQGKFGSVLVVTANKATSRQLRFQRYGIFSDAASSCVVTKRPTVGFDIVGSALVADQGNASTEPNFGSELACRTNGILFSGINVAIQNVAQVFCNNIYLPVLTLKELEAGFTPDQIFTENVSRIGHCYASDALINLQDYCTKRNVRLGEYMVLAADAPGTRVSVLLQTRQASFSEERKATVRCRANELI